MKIRHPSVIKLAGLGLSWLLRRWIGTLSIRYRNLSEHDVEPRFGNTNGPYLFALWHQDIFSLTARYAGPHLCTIISEHADGQLIAEASRHMRMKTVLGSTTKNGAKAMRQMLRQKEHINLVVTPDGPHGPLHEVKMGVVYLASRRGLPIVPLAVGYRKAWRLRSWDRMFVPVPWGEIVCVGGAPIHVPANAGRKTLDDYCVVVKDALNHANEAAAELVKRTKAPARAPQKKQAS